MCVRDGGNVNMFDLNNLNQPEVRSIKADSTIMHPSESTLALRGYFHLFITCVFSVFTF